MSKQPVQRIWHNEDAQFRKAANNLLRKFARRLVAKYSINSDEESAFSYIDAARHFHECTGCGMESAIRYFSWIEAMAHLSSQLGESHSVKQRLLSTPHCVPKLP